MPRNVEIKARVDDLEGLEARVRRLADRGPDDLDQVDVFFEASAGRLKLRRLGPGRGELIHYRRDDTAGPATSEYRVVETAEPDRLAELLGRALPRRATVRKQRRVHRGAKLVERVLDPRKQGEFARFAVRQPASPGFQPASHHDAACRGHSGAILYSVRER